MAGDRQTFAALFALFMGHFCVKMYLHSLYATILQVDADPSHWFSMFSIIILNLADLVVNHFFAQPRHSVSNGTHLFQLVCGGAFIVAYNLCFLSSATTDVDILRIGTLVHLRVQLWMSGGAEIGNGPEVRVHACRHLTSSAAGETKQS
jgi:hypothetical protein